MTLWKIHCVHRMRPCDTFLTHIGCIDHLMLLHAQVPSANMYVIAGLPLEMFSISRPEQLFNVFACHEGEIPGSSLCKSDASIFTVAPAFGKYKGKWKGIGNVINFTIAWPGGCTPAKFFFKITQKRRRAAPPILGYPIGQLFKYELKLCPGDIGSGYCHN